MDAPNPHPNAASLANLKPWGADNPPPKSPGRPPKRPQSEAYESWLRARVDAQTVMAMREKGINVPTDATNADMVALSMGRQAISGNVLAAKEVREAVEGKSTMRIEMLSHEDRQLDINVTFENLGLKHKPVEQVIDVEPESAGEDLVSDAVERLVDSETQKEIANANGNGNSVAKGIAIGMALQDGEKD